MHFQPSNGHIVYATMALIILWTHSDVHVCKISVGLEKPKVDKIMSVLQNENNIISNLLSSLVYG